MNEGLSFGERCCHPQPRGVLPQRLSQPRPDRGAQTFALQTPGQQPHNSILSLVGLPLSKTLELEDKINFNHPCRETE